MIIPKPKFTHSIFTTTHNTSLALVFVSICIFSACHGSKKVSEARKDNIELTEKGVKANSPIESLFSHIDNNAIRAEWFSGKANITVQYQGNPLVLSGVIQLRKDSVILVVLRKFGFEAARALISKDSVCVLNRLSGEYMKRPLSYVSETLNIPADFATIQDILLGNPHFYDKKQLVYTKRDSTYNLSGNDLNIATDYQFDSKYYMLKNVDFRKVKTSEKVHLIYSNYQKVETSNVSFMRQIEASSPNGNKGSAIIDFTEVEINKPKIIRFEIPSRYRKVDVFEF